MATTPPDKAPASICDWYQGAIRASRSAEKPAPCGSGGDAASWAMHCAKAIAERQRAISARAARRASLIVIARKRQQRAAAIKARLARHERRFSMVAISAGFS